MRLNNKINYQVNYIDRLNLLNPYKIEKRIPKTNQSNQYSTKEGVLIHWSSKSDQFDQTKILNNMAALIKVLGQCPSITTSRKGVARYGIREGAMIGVKVNLRGRNSVRFATNEKLLNSII